ncbi:MAG: S41 family peptidase [bacterium]
MRRKTQAFVVLILVLSAVTFGGWLANSTTTIDPDLYVTLRKNITLFQRIYEEISVRYVDEVDPEAFIKAGIEGMTDRLDPYTNFVEQEENENLRTVTEGKYGGVGMNIMRKGNSVIVAEPPYDGTPAAKAGIREGDQIFEVEEEETSKMRLAEVAQRLRGKPGTAVKIRVKRASETGLLEFRLVRAMITVHDVTYSDLMEGDIGYIRLIRFSRFAAEQLEEALADLTRRGMKGLILDLRSNTGGLLNAAVNVADLFLPEGDLIVYTKGRSDRANMKYYSKNAPLLGDLPMVVVVNELSASASEIVAGAIQDLDRGLIIGSKTYGKGLVQTVVPFSQNAALRLTTAKYYVPSGRLIQDLAQLNRDAQIFAHQDDELTPDSSSASSLKEFRTKAGRLVFGGGGIKPDIEFEPPKRSSYEISLLRQSMFFNFAISYSSQTSSSLEDLEMDKSLIEEFRSYLAASDFEFKLEGEDEINELEKIAGERSFGPELEAHLAATRESLDQIKENEFDNHLPFIRRNLRREIAAKLFGSRGQVEATRKDDPVFQTALEVLTNPAEYAMKLGQ